MVGDGISADGISCCSSNGYCGTTIPYCGNHYCGNGTVGNGVFPDGSTCSSMGFCGSFISNLSTSTPVTIILSTNLPTSNPEAGGNIVLSLEPAAKEIQEMEFVLTDPVAVNTFIVEKRNITLVLILPAKIDRAQALELAM